MTRPNSKNAIEAGTAHGPPKAWRCHTTYVLKIVSDHTSNGNVARLVRNGVSQTRYHGYTTGAMTSATAIGHAQADGLVADVLAPSPTATASPPVTANAAAALAPTRSLVTPNTV